MKTTPLLLLCGTLALVACKKEKKDTAPEKMIVGEWYTLAHRSIYSSSLGWQLYSGVRISFIFSADKTFRLDGVAPVRSAGKWSLRIDESDVHLLTANTGDTTHEFSVTFPHRDTMLMVAFDQKVVPPMSELKMVRK